MRDIHDKVKDPSWFVSEPLNFILNHLTGASVFKQLRVSQVIWGYEDELLKLLGHLEFILKQFGFKLPNLKVIALQVCY